MPGEFEGKVAIVTGAAGGISRVILTRLAEEGAKCIMADINDDWGESSAAALRDRGLDVMYIATDVRYGDQVNAMVARAVETYGRLDILVHGAGVGVHREIVDMSDAEWDLQIDVQLRGAFLLSRAVGRQLIHQGEGGRIILIGSTSGNNARPMSGPHAASKAGEIQLSRVLALEMGKHNITCNVVAPGLTDIAAGSQSRARARSTRRRLLTRCRSGGWPPPMRSPTPCCSSPRTGPASSAARCCAWTAAIRLASSPWSARTSLLTTAWSTRSRYSPVSLLQESASLSSTRSWPWPAWCCATGAQTWR